MSNPKQTQNNVPTTPTAPAWHSRAAGDLNTWAVRYRPSSERAAAVWNAHHEDLEPRISAARAAGVTEKRRIASAVLELLAWALPLVDDLDEALSEDSLQQFLKENPTGLGDGALGNVRGRVRRVLKARGVSNTAVLAPEVSDTETPDNKDPQSSTSEKSAPAETASLVYTASAWSLLQSAAADNAVLAASITDPDAVEAAAWTHARAVASRLNINLTKTKVRRTLHTRALSYPMQTSLAEVISGLGATRRTATDVAPLLPPVDDALYRAILRGEPTPAAGSRRTEPAVVGDCTSTSGRHGDDHLDPTTGVDAPVHAPTGGTSIVSTSSQLYSPENARPATGDEPAASVRRRRKPSARQMRLAVAAANAEREARAATLPESIRTYIREEYVPLEPVRQRWDDLKGPVEATLEASAVRGDDSMRKHVTHLAYFFYWADSVGVALEPSSLTRANVGRYDDEVLVDAGRGTRQTRRSRLNAMADQIHPDQAPVKGPPLAHRSVAPPYSLAEMAVIKRVACVQPSSSLVRQMCLLVGLGAGAGVDSTDIKRLRDTDVIDHGPDIGIEVRVTNLRRSQDNTEHRNQRTVWVLREYEDLVRIGLAGVKRGQLLLGRDAERANVAASVFSRAVLSKDVPDLAQARLRSTWLAAHLQRTTPLNVLLQAAGLTTARTLVELLEHLPRSADAAVLR